AVEAIEDAGQVRRRDARSIVADAHERGSFRPAIASGSGSTQSSVVAQPHEPPGNRSLALEGQLDRSARWGELERIAEEVREDLLELLRVEPGRERRLGDRVAVRDALTLGEWGEGDRDPAHEDGKILVTVPELEPSGLDAGGIEQLLDQAQDACRTVGCEHD